MEPNSDSTARRVILSRIRSALLPHKAERTAAESWADIPRKYRREKSASREAIVELFTERLRDYDAQVLACQWDDLANAIEGMLEARGAQRMLIPNELSQAWLPDGFVYVRDEDLAAEALDACSGVITTCTIAIAETGTIVLQNGPGQGRRALSLVPDYHLCIVDALSVVATVPEGIAALQATSSLPTTFISGPSATADIEMTRIKGVHGPRFLDVILVSADEAELDEGSAGSAV